MFIIHSKPGCPWCEKAKELLTKYHHAYVEHVYKTEEEIAAFKAKGFRTFPQIYNEKGQLIGGYEALVEYLEGDEF